MRFLVRSLFAAVAACALVLGLTTSASAAVTYSAVRVGPIGLMPAIDSSTNTIYSVITDTTDPENQLLNIVAVNGATLQTVGTYTVTTWSDRENWRPVATDLRVHSKSHTLWIEYQDYKGGTYIEQINGTTLQEIRRHSLGGSFGGSLSIDPATGNAYVAAVVNYNFGSDNENTFVRRIDAATGAVADLDLEPFGSGFGYANTAWNSANSAVYVTYASKVYAVSSTLRLASTLTLPDEDPSAELGVTADGASHTIYVTGGSRLYAVAGRTNTVSRSIELAEPGVPVVDPGITTVYVGTGVYSGATLARTGTLPQPATSVNGSTHTIYAAGAATGKGWVITRSA